MSAVWTLLLVVVPALLQEPGDLVDRLRSDSVEERQRAALRLEELGEKVRPLLEAAARDSNLDVAAQAINILKNISARTLLGPELLRIVPGSKSRLVSEGAGPLFLDLVKELSTQPREHPELTPVHLSRLAAKALQESPGDPERLAVLKACARHQLASVSAEALTLLRSEHADLRDAAADVLLGCRPPEVDPDLLKVLDDGSAPVRAKAVQLLGHLRYKETVSSIEPLLGDPDGDVRVAAVDALNELDPATAPLRVRLLDDPDPRLRVRAAKAAAQGKLRSAVPELIRLLDDPAADVRYECAYSLIQLHAREALNAVLARLGDESDNVLRMAEAGVRTFGGTAEIPVLLPLLDSEKASTRGAAGRILVGLKAIEAIPYFKRVIRKEIPDARAAALRALWELGWADADVLLPLLEDADEEVQEEAARIAGALQLKEALPSLRKLLSAPESAVLRRAIHSLWQIGDRESAKDIVPALGSSSEVVRLEALEVLGRFSYTPAAPKFMELLGDPQPRVRGDAARVLAALRVREAVEPIRKLLADPELSVQTSATESLVALSAHEAAGDLVGFLESRNGMQTPANLALRRLRSPEAVTSLLKLLDSEDAFIRRDALDLLVSYRSKDVIPGLLTCYRRNGQLRAASKLILDLDPGALLPGLDADDADVLTSGCEAAAITKSKEAIPKLLRLIEHPDFRVRGAAIHALAAVQGRDAIPEFLRQLEKKTVPDPMLVEALAFLQAKDAIPSIRRLLDRDIDVKVAATGLERLGDPEVLPRMLRRIDDPLCTKADLLVDLLVRWDSKEVLPVLRKQLSSDQAQTRLRAARYLVDLGDRTVVADLRKLVETPDSNVSEPAADALLRIWGRRDLPEALGLLRHPSAEVRRKAMEGLGPHLTPSHLSLLTERLADEDLDVALATLRRLTALKAKEAIPRILPLLKHPKEDVQVQAAITLGLLHATGAAAPLAEWAGQGRETERVLEAIRALDAVAMVPELSRRLYAGEPREAKKILLALSFAGGAEAKKILMEALCDQDEDLRRAALEGLVRMKAADAIPRIRLLLRENPRRGSVRPAIWALGELGAKEAIPDLLLLVKSDEAWYAAEALGRLGAREAIPGLLAILDDHLWGPKQMAAKVLAEWNVTEAGPRLAALLRRGEGDHPWILDAVARLNVREAIPSLIGLLDRREKPDGRPAVLKALVDLRATEAAAPISALVTDSDSTVREAAFNALTVLDRERARTAGVAALLHHDEWIQSEMPARLCSHGFREGVVPLLQQEGSYFALNAIRSPGVWSTLSRQTVPSLMVSDPSEVTRRILRGVGLTPEGIPDGDLLEGASALELEGREPLPVVETLTLLAMLGRRDIILEEGRARFVTSREARAFWEAWWAEESKR
jgi:HEAT repeat protein